MADDVEAALQAAEQGLDFGMGNRTARLVVKQILLGDVGDIGGFRVLGQQVVEGLIPGRTREATKEYLATEDALAQWIGDRCNTGPDFKCSTSELFASWRAWCESTGEFVGSMKRFAQKLEAHDYAKTRIGGSGRNGFSGLAPRSEQ